MNPRLPYVLLVGAAVIIFILSCMLLSRGGRSPSCESQPRVEEKTGSMSQSLVFADLTPEEMSQVVDLDVGGVKNSLVAHDMAFEMTRAPWSPEQQIERPRLTKKVLDTEDQAAFRLHSKMPRYIYFAANSKNKWGHQRGYRIQISSFAGDHIPEASSMERAISWARYQLAVTRRKEEEPTSTSIYNQNDPWMPTVAFADFINNETITNEDLVAWITAGFLHIPHSEDIPNTVTVGNSVGFLLRPYNYYDMDPSIYSHDGVFFTSEQDFTACEINPLACLPKTASCLPNFPPFTYDGFRNMSRL
ncbi:Membrane primary amine oxidase [Lonchura striata]|uniref:Amine oxidase n=1 Tax=Lonchura striata TaxID=40157 RepID=A0A218UMG6_9PASE|nr:Membrane primary amine oxidase [Lonchura striata domestica]